MFNESIFVRPTQNIDVTTSYFLPARSAATMPLKVGYRWRTVRGESISHTGGNAVARYSNSTTTCAAFSDGCNSDLFRDGWTNYDLSTNAAYVQDTYSVKSSRSTWLPLGSAHRRSIGIVGGGQPAIPGIMPAIDFPASMAGRVDNFSPRVGVNYDIMGTGKSVARASYAASTGHGRGADCRRPDRRRPGQHPQPVADLNGDTFVQSDETTPRRSSQKSTALDPTNSTSFLSPGTVDPNVKNDRTREFLVGLQPDVMRNLVVEVNYVWRNTHFLLVGPPELDVSELPSDLADANELLGGGQLRHRDVLLADVDLPSPFVYHERSGSVPRLQRRRVRAEQAPLESLDGQRELRLQQRDRSLGFRERLRGSDQHRQPRRGCVRSGICGIRRWQRLQQRRVALQGQRAVYTPLVGHQRGGRGAIQQGYPFPQEIAITSRPNRARAPRSTWRRSATCATTTCS